MDAQDINNEVKNEIEMRINPSDLSLSSQDLMDIINAYDLDEHAIAIIYSQVVEERQQELQQTADEVMDYFRNKGSFYPSFQEFKKAFDEYESNSLNDNILRTMHKKAISDENQMSLFELVREELKKIMEEDEDDLDMFSGEFDPEEFEGAAMKAAMSDIGSDFVPLGKSKFEKNLDPEEFKADLKRQNLGLPKEKEELSKIAKMMAAKKAHEKQFGVGSLNENLFQIKDAEGNDLKRTMLVKPVSGVDKKGRITGFGDDGSGKMQIIVNWAWPIEMKFTNPDEMGEERVYPESIVLASSKKMEESNSTVEIPTDLRGVKVTYSDGTVIPTSMAAHLTDEEILNYFKKGKVFNIGNGELDNMQAVEDVEIIRENEEELPHADHPNGYTFDTTNLYKWFKDALWQLRWYDEAASSEIMEKAFRRDFAGKFNINENMKKENEEEVNELDECGYEMEGQEEIEESRGLSKTVKNSGDRNVKLRDDHESAPLTNLNESVDKNIKKLFEGKVTKKQLSDFISEQAKEIAKKLL
ncbi:MAG: hypothetical protein AABY15_05210 [Nanoarchaeota archaeon]